RRQDEAPREHQPAVPRGAPPPASWIADVDPAGRDLERRGMRDDRLLDSLRGALPQPGREDPVHRPALARAKRHDELVTLLGAAPLDAGAPPGAPIIS